MHPTLSHISHVCVSPTQEVTSPHHRHHQLEAIKRSLHFYDDNAAKPVEDEEGRKPRRDVRAWSSEGFICGGEEEDQGDQGQGLLCSPQALVVQEVQRPQCCRWSPWDLGGPAKRARYIRQWFCMAVLCSCASLCEGWGTMCRIYTCIKQFKCI